MIDSFKAVENKACKLYIAGKGDLQNYVIEETKKITGLNLLVF